MARETRLTDFGRGNRPGPGGRFSTQFREIEDDADLDADIESQDPFPLFLYGDDEPEPPVFGKPLGGGLFSSRIFKVVMLATLAATSVVAALSLTRLLDVFFGDKTSQNGASAGPSPMVLVNNSPIAIAAPPPAANGTPARAAISTGFDRTPQRQTEIGQPAAGTPLVQSPPPAPSPQRRQMDADEVAAMMKRARGLLAIGDIPSARLLLKRVADAQEPTAAFLLAQTYDPAVLGTPDMRSATPDPAAARNWYRKAAQLGSPDAQQRLAQMKE